MLRQAAALLVLVAAPAAAQIYSDAELARTRERAAPSLQAMLEQDVTLNVPREYRQDAAQLRLVFPVRGPSPLAFWAIPETGEIYLPLESIRFFDDIATLHAWFEHNGCDPGMIQSYLWSLLGQGRDLPAPLDAFRIDREVALAEPFTEDVSGKILSSGMLFILLHEAGHQLLGHEGGLSGTLSQSQETEADLFALEHFTRIGAWPVGVIFFFQTLWWLDPFGEAVAGGTHPVTAARLEAIAAAMQARPEAFSFSEPDPAKARMQTLAIAENVATLADIAGDETFRRFMIDTVTTSYPPDGFAMACPSD